MAIEPSGTDPTNLWTAIAGGLATAIALGVTAFSQHIWKKREAIERPVDYEIAQGEIADMRPARKLVNELGPKIENMYSKMEIMMDRADGREGVLAALGSGQKEFLEKLDEVLTLLRSMEKQHYIDKAIREDRERRIDRASS